MFPTDSNAAANSGVEDSEVAVVNSVVADSEVAVVDMFVHLANGQPGPTELVSLAYAAVHVHKLQANCGTCGFGKMCFLSILLKTSLPAVIIIGF